MLPPWQSLLILAPVAYLMGSLPFGLLVGLSRGVDPRKAGSGNIGATNVGRLLGKRYFALVLALDMLKGLFPMVAADFLLRGQQLDATACLLWLLIGFAAIAGHMFSIFLRFKGGKGVATSTGVMLGVFPYYTLAALVVVPVFLVVFKSTRYVSAASIAAAISFPLAYVGIGLLEEWPVTGAQLPLLIFACVVALLILIKHRANIARLRAGTEHRAGQAEVNVPLNGESR
jgi:glycerol-3-phosphate acyltransferase PlsY